MDNIDEEKAKELKLINIRWEYHVKMMRYFAKRGVACDMRGMIAPEDSQIIEDIWEIHLAIVKEFIFSGYEIRIDTFFTDIALIEALWDCSVYRVPLLDEDAIIKT